MVNRLIFRSFVLCFALAFAPAAAAEDGVSAKEVVVGMANAQSGPAAALGTIPANLVLANRSRYNQIGDFGRV